MRRGQRAGTHLADALLELHRLHTVCTTRLERLGIEPRSNEHGPAGWQRHEAPAVAQLRLVVSRLHLLHALEACDRPWSEQQLELLLTCGLEGGRGQRAPLPKKERWTNPARFTALTFEQGQKNLRVGFQRGQPKETNKLR